ncbi:unnamed protein product, partial [Mesorhabditis belari]|uniref:Protein kinase domain-containing protein n=1 Tax=Mesorhabditis belari TaxID=2138241 RepID=A0AAF3FLA4_9BILA
MVILEFLLAVAVFGDGVHGDGCVYEKRRAICDQIPSTLPTQITTLNLTKCPTNITSSLPNIQTIHLSCPLDWTLFPNLTTIYFSGDHKVLNWIDFSVPSSRITRNLYLQTNLSCECENQWLVQSKNSHSQSLLGLPVVNISSNWTCDFTRCSQEIIRFPKERILELGDTLEIETKIPKSGEKNLKTYPFFRYLSQTTPRFEEIFDEEQSIVKFRIENVTKEHMERVAFSCWTCRVPQTEILTIRVRVNVTLLTLEDTLHRDQHNIFVHGWPLNELTITLVSNDSFWIDEQHELGDEMINFRNESLYLKHIHSFYYMKEYTLYARQCSTCEHDLPRGNFSLRVCTNVSCAEKTIHLATHHQPMLPPTRIQPKPSTTISLWPFLIITPFLVLCAFCVYMKNSTLSKLMRFLRISNGKKPGDGKIRIRSKMQDFSQRFRRTSRATEATEETTLRMEERGSLCVSDYTGHLIPVISLGNVQIKEKIGQGAFGEVYRGVWTSSNDREVAVKTIHQADNETEKEAQVLSKLDHPNIVRLFGMTRDGNRMLLILEMMNLGDLKNYLRQRKPHPSNYSQFPPPLELKELLFIIREIIQGLCYLNSQQIVHRDLAARNCLVSGEDDSRICIPANRPPSCVKISDFGMSRRLYSQSEYYKMQTSGSLLPVRWLPPESLNSCRFSHQSDIWALGITMWEIFTYGETPFSDLSNNEVVALGLSGVKPAKPQKCPDEIYELMEKCWELDPEKRISAEDAMLEPCLQAPLARPRIEQSQLDSLCFEVDVPDDIAPLISNAQT